MGRVGAATKPSCKPPACVVPTSLWLVEPNRAITVPPANPEGSQPWQAGGLLYCAWWQFRGVLWPTATAAKG